MDDDDEIERILREELGDDLGGMENDGEDDAVSPRLDDELGDW